MQDHIWKDWLNKRGVTDAVIEEFGLRAGLHHVLGTSIVIPIAHPDGVFSFNKYRRDPIQGDVKPKYLYDSGSQATLYAVDKIAGKESVLITEGELDTLVAWSANIPAVSSTGGAMTFHEEWGQWLEGKDVTLCFDNDQAGGKGMVKVLSVLPHAHVLFLPDRPGVKDISDYVGSGGKLHELIRARMRFESLQDVIDDRARRLSLWQSTHFHDAYIEEHTVPTFVRSERKTGSDSDEVARAKTYPIGSLIKFDKTGKALCIWHNEKTPSLHYFKKTNSVYCFGGCGRAGDAIDVYRQLKGCSFGEAVKSLQ